jgi:hypothetical protein
MSDLNDIVDIQITISDTVPSASSGGGGGGGGGEESNTPGAINVNTASGLLQTENAAGPNQGKIEVGV